MVTTNNVITEACYLANSGGHSGTHSVALYMAVGDTLCDTSGSSVAMPVMMQNTHPSSRFSSRYYNYYQVVFGFRRLLDRYRRWERGSGARIENILRLTREEQSWDSRRSIHKGIRHGGNNKEYLFVSFYSPRIQTRYWSGGGAPNSMGLLLETLITTKNYVGGK